MGFYKCEESMVPEDIATSFNHGPLTCKPRFVIYLEGDKKIEVNGPDYTALETACNKFCPSLDD